VLPLKPFGQGPFIQTAVQEIVIRFAFAGKDRPPIVNKRHYYRRRYAFVFGLDVVNDTVEFDVSVITGDHKGFEGNGESRRR